MKKVTVVQIILFLIITNVKAQSPYYDAIWLKERLIENTFTTENTFNKKEDSLQTQDQKISAKIKFFKNGNDIHKQDSITFYNMAGLKNAEQLKIVLAEKDDSLFSVLKKYFPEIKPSDRSDDISAVLQKNPFLTKKITYKGFNRDANNPIKDLSISNIFSSIGGLDITTIADGFAKFIVKRTKKELSIAFFDKFKEFISKYPDLKTVFPQTYRALSLIGDEIYNYEAYIQTLRESFENDLSTLEKNLPSIIENHPDFFKKHPELAATLNSGCYIAGKLEDKVHPGDILKDYPTAYLDNLNKNWKGAIQTLQLFSASLRDSTSKTDSVYWVSPKQVKEFLKDDVAFRIYLGLVYQEAKNKYDSIHFSFNGKDTTLIQLLDIVAVHFETYSAYKDFITGFCERTDKLNGMIKNYKKPTNDSLTFEQYYQYFNSSINLLQYCTEISKLPYLKNIIPDLSASLKDYFDVAHSTGDLVLDIRRRNYSSAIVNAVHIYDIVKAKYTIKINSPSGKKQRKANEELNKKVTDLVGELEKGSINTISNNSLTISTDSNSSGNATKNNVTNKEVADILIQKAAIDPSFSATRDIVKKLKDSLQEMLVANSVNKQMDDTLRKLYKYGSFMAAMVQAKSSDDVAKVIEAYALPTGSARIKRASDFNVSLNAYSGLFYGFERISHVDSGKWQANVFGVAAPIGVAASWGHRLLFIPMGERQWSTSIFVSLIDIGAITAFRFRDDSTANVPTIQLRDILSPGAFLSIGIPKCPLSVNVGAQMGPNLRKVNNNDPSKPSNDYYNKTYWRFSASLCVDIPLLNFYTRSKN